MKRIDRALLAALSSLLLGATASHADQLFVYPAKGQDAKKQSEDEAACHQWAQKQTGVDPQKIAQQTVSGEAYVQPQGGYHRVLGGAAGGAALGAIGGAIGGDAGEGAAIGAAVGATARLFQARRQVREQEQYNAAVSQEQQARLNEYQQAYRTCLTGRGYTVSQ